MKAAVVGAGASGIFSALALARFGIEVVLLEANASVAPLLRGFSRSGLRFDVGFHSAGALEPGGILRRYLRFAGVLEHLTPLPQDEECCKLFRFTGGEEPGDICLPVGMRRTASRLAELWPGHAAAVTAFCEDMERRFRHSPFTRPESITELSQSLAQGERCGKRLDALRLPPRLASLLTMGAAYYGVAPRDALFEELALVTCSMSEGVHRIQGGGFALAAACEKALAAAGVECRTGCAVNALHTDADNTITAVETDRGERIACDACIYTGHPVRLPGLLPHGALRPSMVKRLGSLEESLELFMLFASSASGFLRGRELFLCASDDINEAFSEKASASSASSWAHLFCGEPDATGRYPVFAGAPLRCPPEFSVAGKRGERPPGYALWKKERAETLAAHVRKHVPELSDLRIIDAASACTMRDWIHGGTGSLYGLAHRYDALPVLPLTRVRGLYLAGQNIILPGLLGAAVSAAVAAGNIVGFPRFFQELACTDAE